MCELYSLELIVEALFWKGCSAEGACTLSSTRKDAVALVLSFLKLIFSLCCLSIPKFGETFENDAFNTQSGEIWLKNARNGNASSLFKNTMCHMNHEGLAYVEDPITRASEMRNFILIEKL